MQRLKQVLAPPTPTPDTASSSDTRKSSKGSVSTPTGGGSGSSVQEVTQRVPRALQALFPECEPAFWAWYATAVPTPTRLAVVVPARNAAATLLEALQVSAPSSSLFVAYRVYIVYRQVP